MNLPPPDRTKAFSLEVNKQKKSLDDLSIPQVKQMSATNILFQPIIFILFKLIAPIPSNSFQFHLKFT